MKFKPLNYVLNDLWWGQKPFDLEEMQAHCFSDLSALPFGLRMFIRNAGIDGIIPRGIVLYACMLVSLISTHCLSSRFLNNIYSCFTWQDASS